MLVIAQSKWMNFSVVDSTSTLTLEGQAKDEFWPIKENVIGWLQVSVNLCLGASFNLWLASCRWVSICDWKSVGEFQPKSPHGVVYDPKFWEPISGSRKEQKQFLRSNSWSPTHKLSFDI